MRKLINSIWIGLGVLSLGMGMLGVVLPVLPTTPFLLLSAALSAKGSRRFHLWLTGTKIYQRYIDQALLRKEMTRKSKVSLLGTISLLLAVGFVFSPVWYAKGLIVVIAVFHYYYFLFRIRTVKAGQP